MDLCQQTIMYVVQVTEKGSAHSSIKSLHAEIYPTLDRFENER